MAKTSGGTRASGSRGTSGGGDFESRVRRVNSQLERMERQANDLEREALRGSGNAALLEEARRKGQEWLDRRSKERENVAKSIADELKKITSANNVSQETTIFDGGSAAINFGSRYDDFGAEITFEGKGVSPTIRISYNQERWYGDDEDGYYQRTTQRKYYTNLGDAAKGMQDAINQHNKRVG